MRALVGVHKCIHTCVSDTCAYVHTHAHAHTGNLRQVLDLVQLDRDHSLTHSPTSPEPEAVSTGVPGGIPPFSVPGDPSAAGAIKVHTPAV